MAPICNSHLVLFNPLGTPGPTILTAAQNYNKPYKHLKWGSAVSPYPDPVMVYHQLVVSVRATLRPDASRGGSSYPRTLVSPEWVVLVKLYAMKALWPYRYECRGGPQRADYNQQMLNR